MTAPTSATLAQVFAAADAGVAIGAPSLDLVAVPLDRIVPSRWQPRRQFDPAALLDLANDIAQHGVLTPPLVWQNEDLEWELIAGERRVRACYALSLAKFGAGMKSVDQWVSQIAKSGFVALREQMGKLALTFPQKAMTVHCRQVWGKPEQLHELALVDNLQRADLTALEEATALHDLIQEYAYTQRQLGERLGKSQTWISQRLTLLDLSPDVAAQVASGDVDPATARSIARLEPAVQSAVVEHLKKFSLRSKAAANLVEKIIGLADPQALAEPVAADFNSAERRLACAGLAQLDIAGRQAAVLKMAATDPKGALRPPGESRQYKDLIVATGIAGGAATRYDLDTTALWNAQAAAIGATCATCQINAYRGLVAGANEMARSHNESYRTDARWPRCANDVSTCQAHTPADLPIRLALGYGSQISEHVTDPERRFVTREPSGWTHVSDPAVWAAILQRKYAAEEAVAAQRADQKANGLATALAAYYEATQGADFDAGHFWCQPCFDCVFHKVGATDPQRACQYQANPPAWESYDNLIARLWRSGNAPAIGRCRLFRLKQANVRLPTLFGGLDLPAAGVLHLLELAAGNEGYGHKRAARWLDVKRTKVQETPTWSDSEPLLRTLIASLTPGQKLALLFLWRDPFGFGSLGRPPEVFAYTPSQSLPLTYTAIRDLTR